MQVQDGSVFATLCVERLADMMGVRNRGSIPQTCYQWPSNTDSQQREFRLMMRNEPSDVPLHVLGILPAWVLVMLATSGEWTEVWVCHVEDGTPWLRVSKPGTNGDELPTITGVVWANPTDSVHLWAQSEVTANGGRDTGTKLQRNRLGGMAEQHGMNTCVPRVRSLTTPALFLSCIEQDNVPQVQQQLMVARAAWAYSQLDEVRLVAVEFFHGSYVVVHSTMDEYGVGSVISVP